MKYPLDQASFVEFLDHIKNNSNMQTVIITKMSQLLEDAIEADSGDNAPWYDDAKELLKDLNGIKSFHDGRRFNEENLKKQQSATPSLPALGPHVLSPDDKSHIVGLPGLQFDESLNLKANQEESSLGESWDEESLAKYFKEKRPKKVAEEPKTLKNMTMEEIEALERAQDESNDIYKIKARTMNIARNSGAAITPVGEILVNSFVHMLKSLYEFAEKIEDKNTKVQLISLVRSQENIPGSIINASMVGLRIDKKES